MQRYVDLWFVANRIFEKECITFVVNNSYKNDIKGEMNNEFTYY